MWFYSARAATFAGSLGVVYASLVSGVTTVVFEEIQLAPREVNEKYDVSEFYVAPTVLKLLKRAGDAHCKNSMKHLRTIGSVDKPVAADV